MPALLTSFRKNALHRKTFTHRSFCTEKHLHIHKSFYTEKLLQKNFYTQQAYTQRGFYTEQAFTHSKLLHREAFTLSKLFHREAFTHRRSLYTEKRLHREAFRHSKFLHTESFTERSFYTQQAFTQRSFTQSKLLRRSFYTEQVFPSIDSLATSIPISTQPSGTSCDKCRIMRVSGIQAGDKCNNVRPGGPEHPATQSVVGEHTRNANPETETKSYGPGMQPFQRSKHPIQVNLFWEESGQRRILESPWQGGKETAEMNSSDLERVVLTLPFRMGEDQKAWLKHDFLMLPSQAGKSKRSDLGVT